MANYKTFADLYGEARTLVDVGSSDTTFLALVKNCCNMAYRKMLKADTLTPMWFLMKRGTFNLAAGSRSYHDGTGGVLTTASVTDIGKIHTMSVAGYKVGMVDHDVVDQHALRFWDDTVTEDYPKFCLHEQEPLTVAANSRSLKNTLTFFYMPSSVQAVRLSYERQVQDLSADTDIPVLPPEFHQAIIFGAASLLEKYGFSAAGSMSWQQLFLDAMNDLVATNRTRFNYVEDGPAARWARM